MQITPSAVKNDQSVAGFSVLLAHFMWQFVEHFVLVNNHKTNVIQMLFAHFELAHVDQEPSEFRSEEQPLVEQFVLPNT